MSTPSAGSELPIQAPSEPYGKLFLRFLRFGSLAWGGPVAQIDMIRNELVEQERWISRDHFKRLLAVYQVLPGPEAHELCVHFGMLSRGRWGGVLAGLGFMLPGFVLMFALSWLYLSTNLVETRFPAVFLGIQPAVIALIVRACHRIGGHCLTDASLWAIAAGAALGEFLGLPFWITLPLGGLAYLAAAKKRWASTTVVVALFVGACLMFSSPDPQLVPKVDRAASEQFQTGASSSGPLFVSGLRAGLLTFGGAYTAIPFLKDDAVERGAWMSERDFLDGVAISGILPAPLIIFSTFVGYFGGGAMGALAMTLGIFLPAFAFSLHFHRHLEAVVTNPTLKHFLEGVTAGVVGLIALTTISLGLSAITSWAGLAIFIAALIVVYLWKAKFATPAIMLACGLLGAAIF